MFIFGIVFIFEILYIFEVIFIFEVKYWLIRCLSEQYKGPLVLFKVDGWLDGGMNGRMDGDSDDRANSVQLSWD